MGDGDLEDGTGSHPSICVATEDRCNELLSALPPRVGSGLRPFLGVERPKKLFVRNSKSGKMLLSAGGNASCEFDSVPPEFPALAASTAWSGKEG